MKTTLVIAIGVFCAGASGVAWNAARATHEAKATLAAVAQQEVATNAQIRLAEERAGAAEREEANLRSVLAGLQQPRAADSSRPPSKAAVSALSAQAVMQKMAEEREHASRPIGQLRELASQRKQTAITYRPLFGSLGLSPAQIERFIEIELKRFETSLDMKPLFSQGLLAGRDDPIAAKIKAKAQAEADASDRELLGESGYRQFHEFRRTEVARQIVGGLAGVAVMAGAPYTGPQLEQLVQALANSDSRFLGGQDVQWHTIDWSIADAKLRPLMSDAQWTLFQTTDSGWNQHYSRSFGAQERATRADTASKAAPATQSGKPPGR